MGSKKKPQHKEEDVTTRCQELNLGVDKGKYLPNPNEQNKEDSVALGNQLVGDKNAIPNSQLIDTPSEDISADSVIDQDDVSDFPIIIGKKKRSKRVKAAVESNLDNVQSIENNHGRTYTREKDPRSLDPSASQII